MWKATEYYCVDDDNFPVKHSWLVEYIDDEDDDPVTVKAGRDEDDNAWLGFTEEDAKHLAFVLNGYGQEQDTRPGEWN